MIIAIVVAVIVAAYQMNAYFPKTKALTKVQSKKKASHLRLVKK